VNLFQKYDDIPFHELKQLKPLFLLSAHPICTQVGRLFASWRLIASNLLLLQRRPTVGAAHISTLFFKSSSGPSTMPCGLDLV